MKEISFWNTSLLTVNLIKIIIELPNIDLYLIGSALNTKNANDLDLVIIYHDLSVSFTSLINLRRQLRDEVRSKFNKDADVMVLSFQEAMETAFFDMPYALIYA